MLTLDDVTTKRLANRYHMQQETIIGICNIIDCDEDTFMFYLKKAEVVTLTVEIIEFLDVRTVLMTIPFVALGMWKQAHDIELDGVTR